MASSDLDLIDPDEFYAELERRAQQRRARRTRRRPPKRYELDGHDHRHHHGHDEPDQSSLRSSTAGRALIAAAAVMALATVIGLIALWPSGHGHQLATPGFGPSVSAHVLSSTIGPCGGPSPIPCRNLVIAVRHTHANVDLGPINTAPTISVGTPITVAAVKVPSGSGAHASAVTWQFVDIDRHGSLEWLVLVLLVLTVAVIRTRGLLAALGVAVSLLLVVTFLVPAILDGRPALLVALISGLAVMFVTLVLTSGFGPQTLAASLGIGSTLMLVCLLAVLAVHFAHIDGRTDELSAYLGTVNPNISLQGIVVAGMVIGALGALVDTAVTQASAVMALRRADPTLTPRRLYRAAFMVGRDHLSATIHTLVLAYVGASLPLLLITRATGVGFIDAVNTQDIAEPIVATLIGCMGLVCAVPLTTGLASVLVARLPAASLHSVHAHQH